MPRPSNDVGYWLDTFEIELGTATNAAFNNGRQQIMVVLKVAPIEGMAVTPEDLDTLAPAVLLHDGTYSKLPEYDASVPWGWCSEHDERFDYFDGHRKLEEPGLLSKVYYIQTTAQANSILNLRAQITDARGTTYYTDDTFLSEITLIARRSPTFVFPDNYNWSTAVLSGDWLQGEFYVHEHRLGPTAGSFVEAYFLNSHHQALDTDGMLRWQARQDEQTRATDVGFVLPGSSVVRRNASYPHTDGFNQRSLKTISPPAHGTIVAVVQGDTDIPYLGTPHAYDRPCLLGALDNHGNEHLLSIAFSEGGNALEKRTYLDVTALQVTPGHSVTWLAGVDIQVTSCSNRAYNNGRQQIEVTLSVEPGLDQLITPQQLASLIPMVGQAGAEPVPLSTYTEGAQWWYSTEADSRFDFLAPTVEQLYNPGLPGRRANQCKRFYVHTRADEGASLTLHAGIQQHADDATSFFYSNNSVELLALKPPGYSREDFHWACTRSTASDGPAPQWLHEYALRLTHVALSYVEVEATAHTRMLRWSGVEPNLAAHLSIMPPTAPGVSPGTQPGSLEPGETQLGAGGLKIVVQVDKTQTRDPQAEHTDPCAITVHDRYGNRHALWVSLADDQFSSLRSARPTLLDGDTAADPVVVSHFQVLAMGLPAPGGACVLFANGYQQAYVDIAIEAQNMQGETIDAQALLDKVTLVSYPDMNEIKTLGYEYTRSRSETDLHFDYYPGVARAETSPAMNVTRFWIKTSKRENLRVGAMLEHAGTRFDTCNSTSVDQSGKTTAGRSNSHAVVAPVAQNYWFRKANLNGKVTDHGRTGLVDMDLYEWSLNSASYRFVYSQPADDVFVFDYAGGGNTNRSTCYRCDKQRVVNGGGPFSYNVTINTRPGVIYATRAKLYGYHTGSDEYTRSSSVLWFDQHGNPHGFTVGPSAYSNDGTNTISVSDR